MKQISDQSTKLQYLNDRLFELQQEKEKNDAQREQQEATLRELREKMAKLKSMADSHGISLENHEQQLKEYKDLEKTYDKLSH